MATRRTYREKVSRLSVVDQVSDMIKQDIVKGVWESGTKLPSEADLAEEFGVNRLSVRMALQKLNTLGFVKTLVGKGTFVENFSLKPYLREITILYEDEKHNKEVVQLRQLLEYECMRLAVYSATEEEKEELRQALDEYNDLADQYGEDPYNDDLLSKTVDADFHFHYTVVKMSHNSLYEDIYYMVEELIRDSITKLLRTRSIKCFEAGRPLLRESDTHTKIYRGIVNGEGEDLRRMNEEMLGIQQVEGCDYFDEQKDA